jgi:dipeptidyl aminopeptidase/acylaminoacyl peptidase
VQYHLINDILLCQGYTSTLRKDKKSFSSLRELYPKTAPKSNLSNVITPVLIQHGKEDRRVPFSNAMELYPGLQEMGIPMKLWAFPGMGHGINKPRECRAVMSQNLAWFSHYLLGEEELR